MLPHGFQWNEYNQFELRGYVLITIDPATSPVTLINVMRSCLPRRLFFSTHEIAIRYSEMWACKWEKDIRLFIGNKEGAAEIERRAAEERRKNASPPTFTSEHEYRRRHGARRKIRTILSV